MQRDCRGLVKGSRWANFGREDSTAPLETRKSKNSAIFERNDVVGRRCRLLLNIFVSANIFVKLTTSRRPATTRWVRVEKGDPCVELVRARWTARSFPPAESDRSARDSISGISARRNFLFPFPPRCRSYYTFTALDHTMLRCVAKFVCCAAG